MEYTNHKNYIIDGAGRRWFLKQSSALVGMLALPPLIGQAGTAPASSVPPGLPMKRAITLRINRKAYRIEVEPRETLLDVLRERLDLIGSKKGCDHGQCGACTVHIDGRTANACLLLAVMQQDRDITTIEGLAPSPDRLHPLQTAFVEHDGLQCGFCTPGQIMSGVAVLREGHAGSTAQIKEWMSGNICRCGAYSGIVDAIEAVQKGGRQV
ncbi:(2Fe-2S)-binding protein [Spirosoma utsteinense]|uniref:Xanthine dehydrogenase YagT iron-sulfur-binding subunit n=1 Tax=Spirosoma utsteinense TaxID=2585773 RepID=A0ABR6W8A5_9BACT|nr:(2Fe-2S)-binding protein [Spirosoma utsteinense]MBC3787888.1 xanthine dehydrogenase YagT iron-sulfur-binding subunit [Spirosoma utsteinense]MBC3792191.1 xanthine dehydrogenase YagT iron-sulfur-binding subunit [Spirosoma utsteinense]